MSATSVESAEAAEASAVAAMLEAEDDGVTQVMGSKGRVLRMALIQPRARRPSRTVLRARLFHLRIPREA